MKKITILFAAALLSCTIAQQSHAQLLKKLKDKVTGTTSSTDNPSFSSLKNWQAVTNAAELFAKNKYKIVGYDIDVNDRVQKALAMENLEKTFAGRIFIFRKNGKYEVLNTVPAGALDNVYLLNGSTMNFGFMKDCWPTNLYTKDGKLSLDIHSSDSRILLTFEPIEMGAKDLADPEILKKAIFTFESKQNKKLYYSVGNGGSASDGAYVKYFYDFINETYLQVMRAEEHTYRSTDLDYIQIPIDKIKVDGLKVVTNGNTTSIRIPLEQELEEEHHTEDKLYSTKTSLFYTLPYGYNRTKFAQDFLDKLAIKLPTAKKAAYAKLAPQRNAEIAKMIAEDKRVDAEYDAKYKASLQGSSNSSTSSSSSSSQKLEATVELKNRSKTPVDVIIKAPAGSSKNTFSINASSSKRERLKVGSTVLVNGSVVLTITADMDGSSKIIAQ